MPFPLCREVPLIYCQEVLFFVYLYSISSLLLSPF